ncbi:4a-hydroxytetrahydrobiopterin dehydratase [uncultured Jatrophihabitans sp.]|uniref:4a-hydroxytetrahydrobiopterin dehydratase n=1 Tax=uncultured Jatrophihabitans sp. TaxID=1610747 RepID=UPI0035CB0D4B
MPATVLDQPAIDERLAARHPGWAGSPAKLTRAIEFADFPTAVEFVNRLAPRCEELDHHPDLGLRWRWVDVELSTHSAGGVTELDLTLAEIVDEVAATLPLAD